MNYANHNVFSKFTIKQFRNNFLIKNFDSIYYLNIQNVNTQKKILIKLFKYNLISLKEKYQNYLRKQLVKVLKRVKKINFD